MLPHNNSDRYNTNQHSSSRLPFRIFGPRESDNSRSKSESILLRGAQNASYKDEKEGRPKLYRVFSPNTSRFITDSRRNRRREQLSSSASESRYLSMDHQKGGGSSGFDMDGDPDEDDDVSFDPDIGASSNIATGDEYYYANIDGDNEDNDSLGQVTPSPDPQTTSPSLQQTTIQSPQSRVKTSPSLNLLASPTHTRNRYNYRLQKNPSFSSSPIATTPQSVSPSTDDNNYNTDSRLRPRAVSASRVTRLGPFQRERRRARAESQEPLPRTYSTATTASPQQQQQQQQQGSNQSQYPIRLASSTSTLLNERASQRRDSLESLEKVNIEGDLDIQKQVSLSYRNQFLDHIFPRKLNKYNYNRNQNNHKLATSFSTSSIFALYLARYARDKFNIALRSFKKWYHEQLTYHHLSKRMEFNQRIFDDWYRSRGSPLSLRALDHYDQMVIWIAGEFFKYFS